MQFYEYNLAGGLTKLIDPFNAVVNYALNKSGQVTGITAPGYPGSYDVCFGYAVSGVGRPETRQLPDCKQQQQFQC